MKNRLFVSLVLLYLAYIFTAFFKISANIVMPIYQTGFNLSSSSIGIITSLYYASYAIVQLFTGPLCNKYGSLNVVGCGFICSTVGALCFAFASSPVFIAIGRFCVGIGAGTVFVSIVAFLTYHFSGRKYALYSGLSVTCSGFGQFIASAPLKLMISKYGIKVIFSILAVFMGTVALFMLILGKNESKNNNAKTGVFKQIINGAKYSFSNLLILFLALLWAMFNSFQHSYQGLWSSSYSSVAFADKILMSGWSASLVSLGLMAGTAFSEIIRLKSSSRRFSVIVSEAFFALSTISISISHNVSFTAMLVCDFILGFAIGHICIQMTCYTKSAVGNSINATVIGFMNFFSCLGTILFQWLTGFSVDILGGKTNSSFTITFALYSALVVIAVICTITLQAKHKEYGSELE